jgi:hypothetical protein
MIHSKTSPNHLFRSVQAPTRIGVLETQRAQSSLPGENFHGAYFPPLAFQIERDGAVRSGAIIGEFGKAVKMPRNLTACQQNKATECRAR